MLQLTVNERNKYAIDATEDGNTINGVHTNADISFQPNGLISILHNGKSYTAFVENINKEAKEVTVAIDGKQYTCSIEEPLDLLLSNMGLNLKAMQRVEPVKAPMPGLVLKILVEPGQEVEKGDPLLILEAMKMENVLKATAKARVKAIKATERTAVEKGAILIDLE